MNEGKRSRAGRMGLSKHELSGWGCQGWGAEEGHRKAREMPGAVPPGGLDVGPWAAEALQGSKERSDVGH